IDDQTRQFGIVEPAPLRRFHRRRQDVHAAGVLRAWHGHQLLRGRLRRDRWLLLRQYGSAYADRRHSCHYSHWFMKSHASPPRCFCFREQTIATSLPPESPEGARHVALRSGLAVDCSIGVTEAETEFREDVQAAIGKLQAPQRRQPGAGLVEITCQY